MGFWNSIKDAAIKAKCGVGIHSGSFKTPEGKPVCYLEKTCPDCGKLVTDTRHEFLLDWEKAPYALGSGMKCTRVQPCIHCQQPWKKVVHGEYKKLGVNGQCKVILACVECGEEKTEGEQHHFHRVGTTPEGRIIMECYDCKKTETRKYV